MSESTESTEETPKVHITLDCYCKNPEEHADALARVKAREEKALEEIIKKDTPRSR
jgi:hypothetical protein